MAVKLEYFISAIFLAIFLTSCASDLSEGFNFDYSSAKVSDFNGRWWGRVDCNYSSGYKIPISVEISDGVGELRSYSNPGKWESAAFDLQTGKIKWAGNYVKISGHDDTFYLNGQWRENEFRVKGQRGSFICSGELRKLGT